MKNSKILLLALAATMISASGAYSQGNTKGNETMATAEATPRAQTDEARNAKVREREQFDAYIAVSEALAPYLEGAAAGNPKQIQSAFEDYATMAGTVGGNFSQVNAIAGFQQFEIAPSPALRAHIAWIDISGPVAAAKVEFIDWMGMRYTDYLLLVRRDEGWKISGKVFDAHSGGSASD